MQKFGELGGSLAHIDWDTKALKAFSRNFYKVIYH
jgi:hypothetical protein